MKTTALLSVLALSFALAACGKKEAGADAAAAEKASAAASAASAPAEKDKPRVATYDPNLKPAQIVWDSPEKKRQWEERQAKIRAQQAAGAKTGAAPHAAQPASR